MILEIGKAGKVRFIRGIKKTNIFECGPNGIVVERENNIITLYATDSRCSKIYCRVTLGDNESLKKVQFLCVAYSESIMLLDGGNIQVVVDFTEQKVAVNNSGIRVNGARGWGEDAQTPWAPMHSAMFELKTSETEKKEMDRDAAEQFWTWFAVNEVEIAQKVAAGGNDAKDIIARINSRLCPVFPYEKPKDIEFQLGCNGDVKEFFMYHFNKEPMVQDTEILGQMMPEALRSEWDYITEA